MYVFLPEATFVIGLWVNRTLGLFIDLLNIGRSLSNFSRAMAGEFCRRLNRPDTIEDTKRILVEEERAFLRKQEEQNALAQEYEARRIETWRR